MANMERSMGRIEGALKEIDKKVDTGFVGIHGRLDILNGKTNKNTTDISYMKGKSFVMGIIGGGIMSLVVTLMGALVLKSMLGI